MKPARHNGGHRRIVASVAVGALILSGAAVLGAALAGSGHPSADPARPTVTPHAGRDVPSMTTSRPPGESGNGTPLAASVPIRLRIPAMGVDGALLRLGVTPGQRTVQLPSPAAQAGWYQQSATPGSAGTSVIIGYIAGHDGRSAVFGRLARLAPHDTVTVARKDGRAATYIVDSIRNYRPGALPTDKIYAATATPSLRLITCGGVLPGKPAGNVVVSAHLTTVAPAR